MYKKYCTLLFLGYLFYYVVCYSYMILQVVGVDFLWKALTGPTPGHRNGCCLADEMGQLLAELIRFIRQSTRSSSCKDSLLFNIVRLRAGLGKTLMTVACICGMFRANRDKHFIVVCPSSLVTNWAKEFDKWIGKASSPKRVVIKGIVAKAVVQVALVVAAADNTCFFRRF